MPSGRQLGILRWRHAINHPPAWLTTIFIWDRCRAPSSAMGIRGCRSRFAATPLRGRSDHCRCGRRRDGFLRSATKTDPLCQHRTPFRIGRRGDWVISWQLPPDAIPRGFEPVSDADMPAEHLAEKPALEADDTVALHLAPSIAMLCRAVTKCRASPMQKVAKHASPPARAELGTRQPKSGTDGSNPLSSCGESVLNSDEELLETWTHNTDGEGRRPNCEVRGLCPGCQPL